jgi:hypothetical protein
MLAMVAKCYSRARNRTMAGIGAKSVERAEPVLVGHELRVGPKGRRALPIAHGLELHRRLREMLDAARARRLRNQLRTYASMRQIEQRSAAKEHAKAKDPS